MIDHSIVRRLFTSLTIAAGLVLASSGIAFADTETGQHGHFIFEDGAGADAGVVCVYSGSNPYKLVRLIVKPPALWWWDTNSSSNTEHGRVGWRAIVEVSLPGAYGPFATAFKSSLHKAVAYEDQPPYDMADKAPLSKMRLTFDPSKYAGSPNAYARVTYKAFWYRASGSLAGSVTHTEWNFAWRNVPGYPGSTTACPIRFVP